MSDFSDRPFVAGSLIGLRAFDVDSLGRLVGPSFGGIFKTGENEAVCGGGKGSSMAAMHQMQRQLERSFENMGRRGRGLDPLPDIDPANPDHAVGSAQCACGYYAYFNGENTYAKPNRVSAIVEGYGVCTVGEKGFRASRARLVALVLPKRRRLLGTWKFNAAFIALFIALGVSHAAEGALGWFAFDMANAGFQAFFLGINLYGAKKTALVPVDLIRRNYPGVPTYRSAKKALRNHPLTPPPPPPAPSPEDADFWTRPVKR